MRRPPHPRSARGFALITALILMTGVLVIAAATLRVSTRNERVAGIDLDRALAFQLAEATLREAQQDILQISGTGQACTPGSGCRAANFYPNKDAGLTDLPYVGTCLRGMCYLGPGSIAAPFPTNNPAGSAYLAPGFVNPWDRPDPGDTDPNRPYAQFGEFSPTASWPTMQSATGAARRPRYWIELIPYGTAGDRLVYRITVQAWGRNPQTVAMVQEVYQPN